METAWIISELVSTYQAGKHDFNAWISLGGKSFRTELSNPRAMYWY